jgi:hypothetical protein
MTPRPVPPGSRPPNPPLPPGARHSHALQSLTNYLRAQQGLQILDLGGLNQPNLDFITGLGHRLYAEDLIRSFDSFFTPAEIQSREFRETRIEEFLDVTFEFPDQSSDGALVWDLLQFMPSPVAQAVLARLYRILAPDSFLLAFFHPDAGGKTAQPNACRIVDQSTIQLIPRQTQRLIEPFNTRSIERFFHRFSSVKFFLTRENLHEVIVRR